MPWFFHSYWWGPSKKPWHMAMQFRRKCWPARGYWCSSWTPSRILAIHHDSQSPRKIKLGRCVGSVTDIDGGQGTIHGLWLCIFVKKWPARVYWCSSWTACWILVIDGDPENYQRCYHIDALVLPQLLLGVERQTMTYGHAILEQQWLAMGYWCSSWIMGWILANANDPKSP